MKERHYFAYPLLEEVKQFALTGIKTVIATEIIPSIKNTSEVIAESRYYVTS